MAVEKNLRVTINFYKKHCLPVVTWNKNNVSKQVVPITYTLEKLLYFWRFVSHFFSERVKKFGAIALSYPLGLGLGLRLVLRRVSNRNPTHNPKGVRKWNSAKKLWCTWSIWVFFGLPENRRPNKYCSWVVNLFFYI